MIRILLLGLVASLGAAPASAFDRPIRLPVPFTLAQEGVRQRMPGLGVDRILANTPDEAAGYVSGEVSRWQELLRGRLDPGG